MEGVEPWHLLVDGWGVELCIDLAAYYFWQRMKRWIETVADLETYDFQFDRYRTAATVGPTIISKEEDRRMWTRFSDRSWSVKARILWPDIERDRRW